jgi:hypothetical protein
MARAIADSGELAEVVAVAVARRPEQQQKQKLQQKQELTAAAPASSFATEMAERHERLPEEAIQGLKAWVQGVCSAASGEPLLPPHKIAVLAQKVRQQLLQRRRQLTCWSSVECVYRGCTVQLVDGVDPVDNMVG